MHFTSLRQQVKETNRRTCEMAVNPMPPNTAEGSKPVGRPFFLQWSGNNDQTMTTERNLVLRPAWLPSHLQANTVHTVQGWSGPLTMMTSKVFLTLRFQFLGKPLNIWCLHLTNRQWSGIIFANVYTCYEIMILHMVKTFHVPFYWSSFCFQRFWFAVTRSCQVWITWWVIQLFIL